MSELYHHGIKGQRWGVRRFQNEDGSYTEEGKAWRAKQEGRIQEYSHGTGNYRTAKREVARRATSRNFKLLFGSAAGGLAAGSAIGTIGGPAGVLAGGSAGYAIGAVVGAGAMIVNTLKTQKVLDEMQDYAESSKKYADAIVSEVGKTSVEDILKK